MPRSTLSFIDACLAGDCLTDEIDDFVDQWHEGDSQDSLSGFLGFTPEEYAVWIKRPDSLEWSFHARRDGPADFCPLEGSGLGEVEKRPAHPLSRRRRRACRLAKTDGTTLSRSRDRERRTVALRVEGKD